ncbi:transposase IS4 domain-containing protein [Hirsutella rhossiliensis]
MVDFWWRIFQLRYRKVGVTERGVGHGNALGPAAGKKRKRAIGTAEGSISLNPTQSVVVALVKQLPEQTYHVFFDNLFSSPNLLNALRQLEIGATGTARINCGFYKPFVEAKKADTKGDCWPWGTLKTAPTPDGQVNQFAWKDNALSEFGAGRQQRSLEHAQYSKNSVPSLYYVFLCRLSLQTTLIKWAALILVTN